MAKTVYVFGELNVDFIVSGADARPEPGKEKLVERCELTLGSSSAITACRLAQLGLDVRFVSVVGDDRFGAYCIERLGDFSVDASRVRVDPSDRTGVTVSLSTPEDRALLTFMGTIPKLTPEAIPADWEDEADHIHFGSFYLQKGMLSAWRELFERARSRGVTTSFDLGWDPEERWHRPIVEALLPWTDLFVPSEAELCRVYQTESVEDVRPLLPPGSGTIAVKRGRNGASALTAEGEWLHAPAFPVEAVDTTGAGDSFNAGAIYSFLHGGSPAELLAYGNACGALSTLAVGGTGGVVDRAAVAALLGR